MNFTAYLKVYDMKTLENKFFKQGRNLGKLVNKQGKTLGKLANTQGREKNRTVIGLKPTYNINFELQIRLSFI